MKTLTEINAKWWYRLIKVLFILFVLISCGIAIAVNVSSIGNYQTDYTVSCNYGNKSVFLAAKDKEIYIPSYYDYTDSLANLPDYIKEDVQDACGITSDDLTALFDSYMNGTSDGKKLFDLTETKIVLTTVWDAVLWSIVSIVVILLIAEIIRRVFYYIVLGSLRPKKQ